MQTQLVTSEVLPSLVLGSLIAKDKRGTPDWKNMPADWSDIRTDCPENSIALYAAHSSIYTKVGNPTIENGIVSGFSSSNSIKLAQPFNPSSYSWEIVCSFVYQQDSVGFIGSSVGYDYQGVTVVFNYNKLRWCISSNGTSWDIVGARIVGEALTSGKKYKVKVSYDGTQYVLSLAEEDGEFSIVDTQVSSTPIYVSSGGLSFGDNYILNQHQIFKGSINLNETYIKINGDYLVNNSQYDNLGFTATCTGGYKVYIDGVQYGTTYTSGAKCSITWSTSGITTGDIITTPELLKAHKIWIEPATEGNEITQFKCSRVAASGIEEQGVLWGHFNISNAIIIYNMFGSDTAFKNTKLIAVTAKNNLINYSVYNSYLSGLYSTFNNCPLLEYVPVLKASNNTDASSTYVSFLWVKANVNIKNNSGKETFGIINGFQGEKFQVENGLTLASDTAQYTSAQNASKLKKFPKINQNKGEKFVMSNCPALEPVNIDDRFNDIRKLFRFYGTQSVPTPALKSLRVSNQAPFDYATAPQINVSYTGMDRTALVTLFNDLPTVTDGQIINITGCTGSSYLTTEDVDIAANKGWTIVGGINPAIVSGATSISLPNAVEDTLQYVKLEGGTEHNPEAYLDTATASGKCVQTNVPKEYTQYEYLQSSGTQYIDTGIPVKANTYVRAEFEFTSSTSSTRRLFGKIAGASTGAMNYREYASFYWFKSNTITSSSSGKHVIEFKSDGNVYLDGNVIGTKGTFANGSNLPIYLFAELSDGGNINYGSVKVYRFTVNEDTTVVLDLIPCKRNSDDVLGMYDRISGNFLTNLGTGNFTGNIGVYPTPDNPVDIVCNNGAIKAKHQSGLPFGYTLLDYIESTGTQYINTGYIPTSDIVEYGIEIYGTPDNSCSLFGAQASTGSTRYTGVPFTSGGTTKVYIGTSTSLASVSIPDNQWNKYVLQTTSSTEGKVTLNGVDTDFTYNNGIMKTLEIYLFANNQNDTATQLLSNQVKSFYIKDNGTLVRNFVAAKDSNNIVGMYDLVSGQFFTNTGTGTFTAGNTVSDPIEIYTDGTIETVTDNNGLAATCQNLLSINTYKDTQEILSGAVTRNVGVKVLDGTESWQKIANQNAYYIVMNEMLYCNPVEAGLSNQFIGSGVATADMPDNSVKLTYVTNPNHGAILFKHEDTTTLENWVQFVKDKYNSGNPIIAIYPLATSTTETVSGQDLSKAPVTSVGSVSDLVVNTTSSSHTTPKPVQPLDILCNNGTVKCSSNLFKVSDITTSTVSDVTISASSDGTITANGTSSSPNYSQFVYALSNPITEGTYTVSLYNTDTLGIGSLVGLAINTTVGSRGVSLTSANSVKTITVNPGEICNNIIIRIAGTANNFKFKIQIEKGSDGTPYHNYGQIYTDGTVETIQDSLSNTSTAERLLKVGTYKDVQSILDGSVTRNVGIKVLDGSENWASAGTGAANAYLVAIRKTEIASDMDTSANYTNFICSHVKMGNDDGANTLSITSATFGFRLGLNTNIITDPSTKKETVKAWLKQQYDNGTPVIVVYPLATSKTETVTGQTLNVKAGSNTITVTQASINGLELEAKYYKES